MYKTQAGMLDHGSMLSFNLFIVFPTYWVLYEILRYRIGQRIFIYGKGKGGRWINNVDKYRLG